jgi:carboxypeptidase Taq
MPTTKVFENPTIIKILDYYKNLWAISYLSAVSHWDLEAYMPPMGANARGEALGRISVIRQKMFLDPSFVSLIHKVENERELTDQEKGIVRILVRELKMYEKLPASFLEEFEKLINTGTVIWREAKEKNDYSIFEKTLAKIFDMNKQMAEYLGFSDSPYDALLDQYEENLKTKDVESFFETIKDPLKNLLSKILSSEKYVKDHFLEVAKYDAKKLELLNEKILKNFWQKTGQNFRLDKSTHPFTISFDKNDTRITTWYHDKDFARSIMATVHEFGHALYDMQSPDAFSMTPIEGGSSLVIHESQSRFWENHVGRSMDFVEAFLPDFQSAVGKKVKAEDVYFYLNKVSPSLLRVEADEVTYHFHIMIRFEIEKGIIEGTMKIKDLPEIWNAKMKEYLKITPKKDSEGILQDIHWSGGSVGYFPTYSLGTFLGSQWEEKLKKELKLKKLLSKNSILKTEEWLKENIHQHGSTYTLEELLLKNKMKFDPTANLKYLTNKYSKIYGF